MPLAKKTVKQKMMDLLGDGHYHTLQELKGCLWDELSDESIVAVHLQGIRRELRPAGQDIICHKVDGLFRYRWVRLIAR